MHITLRMPRTYGIDDTPFVELVHAEDSVDVGGEERQHNNARPTTTVAGLLDALHQWVSPRFADAAMEREYCEHKSQGLLKVHLTFTLIYTLWFLLAICVKDIPWLVAYGHHLILVHHLTCIAGIVLFTVAAPPTGHLFVVGSAFLEASGTARAEA